MQLLMLCWVLIARSRVIRVAGSSMEPLSVIAMCRSTEDRVGVRITWAADELPPLPVMVTPVEENAKPVTGDFT